MTSSTIKTKKYILTERRVSDLMKTCLIKNVNKESKSSMSNIMVTYYDAVDHELENNLEKTFLIFFFNQQ